MPEITTTVKAKSAYGIKVEEDGDWWNWSKPEYRGEPFNTEVQKGDRVQITYGEKEYQDKETDKPFTKYFITTIEKVTSRDPVGIAPDPSDMSGSDFPPDEVPYEYPPPDAASEPVEGTLDKDHSIVRQCCIKAAGVALQHNMGSAEEKAGMITYLAGVLEDWCWR